MTSFNFLKCNHLEDEMFLYKFQLKLRLYYIMKRNPSIKIIIAASKMLKSFQKSYESIQNSRGIQLCFKMSLLFKNRELLISYHNGPKCFLKAYVKMQAYRLYFYTFRVPIRIKELIRTLFHHPVS